LGGHCRQPGEPGGLIVQMFHNSDAVFQDDSLPIRMARSVQSWVEEHKDALHHLPWPSWSPDLSIIKPLWSVLESRVRSRYPPPSLKQLEDVLHEEWYRIPLETIQNLHESVPRRIQAVLQANDGPAILMKKCVPFTPVFIILSIPFNTKIRGLFCTHYTWLHLSQLYFNVEYVVWCL
jgi:hypothetical protein